MFWLLALRTIQRIQTKSCECGVVFSQVYFFFLETLTRCILDRRYFHWETSYRISTQVCCNSNLVSKPCSNVAISCWSLTPFHPWNQLCCARQIAYRPTGIRSRAAVTTGLLQSYDPSKQVTLKRMVYRLSLRHHSRLDFSLSLTGVS